MHCVAILFLLAKPLDNALRPLGYNDGFVSYFPFVRYLYSHLISFNENAHPDIMYFHVLDVTVWMSVAVWGSRLVAGIIFLKQYDYVYWTVSRRLSNILLTRGHQLRCTLYTSILYVSIFWVLLTPFVITYLGVDQKILLDPVVNFLVSSFPAMFVFLFASLYFIWGFIFTEPALFLLWKVVRQKRALKNHPGESALMP
jgi:hypothetical protein